MIFENEIAREFFPLLQDANAIQPVPQRCSVIGKTALAFVCPDPAAPIATSAPEGIRAFGRIVSRAVNVSKIGTKF